MCKNENAPKGAAAELASIEISIRVARFRSGEEVHPDLKNVIELQQADLKVAELTKQIESLPAQIQSLQALPLVLICSQTLLALFLGMNELIKLGLEGLNLRRQ